MWQKEYARDKTWQEALSYCENSNYAGYTNWRVPNKNELASLLNYKLPLPISDFPGIPNEQWLYFWSSSTYAGSTDNAWYVYFVSNPTTSDIYIDGDVSSARYVGNFNKTNPNAVMCVRSE